MSTLWTRIRAELGHTADLHAEFDRLPALHDQYADASSDYFRRRVGEQIADIVESIAAHLDASPLARTTAFLGDSDALRADARLWRSGEMPVGP